MRGNNTLSASTGQSPVIMDAEDISAFTINRKFRKIRGAMSLDDSASSNGKYVLEISVSKNIGLDDFAGIHNRKPSHKDNLAGIYRTKL